MGVWQIFVTQSPFSGETTGWGTVPAVSPKPMYHSSWHGPEDMLVLSTLAVQRSQLTCLDTLPYPAWVQLISPGSCTHLQGPRRLTLPLHLHPMSCAHLRTALQKALGKQEVSASPREEISVGVSPGRLLFIYFLPLISEVPQQGAQGAWSP